MRQSPYDFEPQRYELELLGIIRDIEDAETLDTRSLNRIVRRHSRGVGKSFAKSEIIRGYRFFKERHGFHDEAAFLKKVRMKPVRTQSGVAPVTVLTKPYPCPGKCVFCPNDVRMPKSYLSKEPGAQRAAQHRFDPYAQTLSRLYALFHTGHEVDKAELIILGGTWSFYPEPYQLWFVKRCFDAMMDFSPSEAQWQSVKDLASTQMDFTDLEEEVHGQTMSKSYNQIVSGFLAKRQGGALMDGFQEASWEDLVRVQRANEQGRVRCVGLVVETRPDHISEGELRRIRALGATKVQLGFQSLSEEVLLRNQRGHDVEATRRAVRLILQAGFKIHAHWMPNLLGADPSSDIADFHRIFDDPGFRPDELKIYPCSLVKTAELMKHYESGEWRPYSKSELLEVVTACLRKTPPYCRLTRIIRDIPGTDIVVGNKVTNFREVAEEELERQGLRSSDIRSREIRNEPIDPEDLQLGKIEYESSIGRQVFLHCSTSRGRLVGFCRLSLPEAPVFLPEIARSAMIREVHVYGSVVGIGQDGEGRSQHLGIGKRLIQEAGLIASSRGYDDLAVISSVGTREYYRRLGFQDRELYQHQPLNRKCTEEMKAGFPSEAD